MDKDLKKIEADLAAINRKLGNEDFLERAPAEVVEKEKARFTESNERAEKLRGGIERLRALGA
jgi:valyl-tRNA synthetase